MNSWPSTCTAAWPLVQNRTNLKLQAAPLGGAAGAGGARRRGMMHADRS